MTSIGEGDKSPLDDSGEYETETTLLYVTSYLDIGNIRTLRRR